MFNIILEILYYSRDEMSNIKLPDKEGVAPLSAQR